VSDERLEGLRQTYRGTLAEHGSAAEGVRMSPAGQRDRFAQLNRIADLNGRSIADVGCGVGDFYAYLRRHVGDFAYLGVDLMAEMAERAGERFPEASFTAVDVLAQGLPDEYDYVLMSAVFNDPMPDPTGYLRDVVSACWPAARLGLGFNFISDRAQRQDRESLCYHDPLAVLDFCLGLSPHVELAHFYARADVSVFVRRGT
jgi:SAM-dependent methyltransferase